ncbi:dynein intermediate chain 3, ciliary-like [Bicyclus anynana]|uniref:Dynein intermediate chain 3, ciliary-like n=1 Tax=Bicyclus anynana TaxID=110368 RepID=A0A6J1N343_BICAN|nr:dynein intermediate chain 3, ciliary-like [Bicyclus anynana]
MKKFKIGTYRQSNYAYTKLRKTFGRQPLFQIVPAHIIDSINSDVELHKEYVLRNPVHREIQATLPQSEHDTNTKQIVMHEQGINHTEGGWPRDVHLYNEDHLNRHRRRVQHEDNYVHSILNMRPQIEHFIDQNNAIDMYQTYFADMEARAPVEKYNVQIANVFRDPFCRPVSSIAWTDEKRAKLVASYCHKNFQESETNEKNVCYVWDINKQTSPVQEFSPTHGCWQVVCAPLESDILITGLVNGTINVFDIRASSNPVSSSSIYNSHFAPITALRYTHLRTNTEFFTGSPDGQCLWWDKRNLSKPIDRLLMSVKLEGNEAPSFTNSEGVSSLEFDRGLPTKFLCGTESGLIINANRMGRSHSEVLTSYWNAHTGLVRAVQRSPCTLRMFISCGDYRVRIWSEEVRTAPIIVTNPYRSEVTDVCWAPLRYTSYMAVTEDGVFHYWDLIRKYHQPTAKLRVSRHGLNKLMPHPKGQSIGVGDNVGSLFLLHLSENMISSGPNDKQLMHQIYNRETKREHNVDTRFKEQRLKMRVETEPTAEINEDEENNSIDDLEQLTKEYLNTVQEEMGEIGGILNGRFSLI